MNWLRQYGGMSGSSGKLGLYSSIGVTCGPRSIGVADRAQKVSAHMGNDRLTRKGRGLCPLLCKGPAVSASPRFVKKRHPLFSLRYAPLQTGETPSAFQSRSFANSSPILAGRQKCMTHFTADFQAIFNKGNEA